MEWQHQAKTWFYMRKIYTVIRAVQCKSAWKAACSLTGKSYVPIAGQVLSHLRQLRSPSKSSATSKGIVAAWLARSFHMPARHRADTDHEAGHRLHSAKFATRCPTSRGRGAGDRPTCILQGATPSRCMLVIHTCVVAES